MTITDYDWLLRSWDNTDNYTLYMEADLFKDATQLYVGVRSPTGVPSPISELHCGRLKMTVACTQYVHIALNIVSKNDVFR